MPVETSILDSDFRRSFGAIDYQTETGVLELTKDKARGATYSSAGLVAMEVGRALQYRSRFPLLFVQRVMSPFVNFAGYAWIWPGAATGFVPMYFEGATAATVVPSPSSSRARGSRAATSSGRSTDPSGSIRSSTSTTAR